MRRRQLNCFAFQHRPQRARRCGARESTRKPRQQHAHDFGPTGYASTRRPPRAARNATGAPGKIGHARATNQLAIVASRRTRGAPPIDAARCAPCAAGRGAPRRGRVLPRGRRGPDQHPPRTATSTRSARTAASCARSRARRSPLAHRARLRPARAARARAAPTPPDRLLARNPAGWHNFSTRGALPRSARWSPSTSARPLRARRDRTSLRLDHIGAPHQKAQRAAGLIRRLSHSDFRGRRVRFVRLGGLPTSAAAASSDKGLLGIGCRAQGTAVAPKPKKTQLRSRAA